MGEPLSRQYEDPEPAELDCGVHKTKDGFVFVAPLSTAEQMFLDMDDPQWIQEANKESYDEESDEEWYEEDFEAADEGEEYGDAEEELPSKRLHSHLYY